MTVHVYSDYRSALAYSAQGPQPQVWLDAAGLRAVLVALEPGQALPPHPGPAAVYHFLEGRGWMLAGGERVPVQAGATVAVTDGERRGVEAETRLAFLGVRAQGAEAQP